jgi:DNA-binding GntR family transcriptional regulator
VSAEGPIVTPATSLVEAPALRDQVYERLREAILTGELGPGARISPSVVAERFGVSAMPVRDALRLLEQEGLVETAARRWTRVVRLDPALVEELVPLVSLLEQYAVTSATELDEEALARMEAANREFAQAIERADDAACIRADTDFHDALVASGGNASLDRALRDARNRIRLLRAQVLRTQAAGASVRDHEAILAALRAGNRDDACAAIRANWERGVDRYQQRQGP